MSQILLAAYGSPLVFDPTIISGLVLWLKADSLALSNNDPVGTWTDGSGTSNDATQATAGKKPIYKTNVQNGLPVVRFDGTDDILQLDNELPDTASVFVVTATKATPADQAVFIADTGSAAGGILLWADTNSGTNWGSLATPFTTVNSGENLVTDAFNILELTTSVADGIKIYRNGTLKAADGGQGYGGPPTFSAIGGQGNDTSFVNADIGEVLVYNNVISGAHRVLLEEYLTDKWFP